MQGLTVKEIGAIEECIKMEALSLQKLQAYEREASESELRDICRSGADTAQRHIDELLSLLR